MAKIFKIHWVHGNNKSKSINIIFFKISKENLSIQKQCIVINFHFKIMTFYTFYLNKKKDFTLSPDRIFSVQTFAMHWLNTLIIVMAKNKKQ